MSNTFHSDLAELSTLVLKMKADADMNVNTVHDSVLDLVDADEPEAAAGMTIALNTGRRIAYKLRMMADDVADLQTLVGPKKPGAKKSI